MLEITPLIMLWLFPHTIKDDALLGVDLENFRDLMRMGVCQEMEKATSIRVHQTRKEAAEQEEQE